MENDTIRKLIAVGGIAYGSYVTGQVVTYFRVTREINRAKKHFELGNEALNIAHWVAEQIINEDTDEDAFSKELEERLEFFNIISEY